MRVRGGRDGRVDDVVFLGGLNDVFRDTIMLAARNVGRNPVCVDADRDEIDLVMKEFDADQTSLFGEKKQTGGEI